MSKKVNFFWFRRDLRLNDNHGLSVALKGGRPVVPLFIFDKNILEKLPSRDARVEFILKQTDGLSNELGSFDSALRIEHGSPTEIWKKLATEFEIGEVFCNEDYEPYALERDTRVAAFLKSRGITFSAYKDQVIFAKDEVVKENGDPYRVYTPFARAWRKRLSPDLLRPFATAKTGGSYFKMKPKNKTLKELGFTPSGIEFPVKTVKKNIFSEYAKRRDFMAVAGTSHLGIHLRFGTVSIRQLAKAAMELSDTYLGELIWREFFMQILWHFPETVSEPFDSRYQKIEWRNKKEEFMRWCEGQTGYPIVDAGLRELNATGFMHNRARMIVGSFLTKHLLIDWRWGERYFAEKLLDFELASNVGNWQWVAGCGCDAAPYFRIFNPTLQAKKFDPHGEYVKKWVPEVGTKSYPEPMVDHELARRRALATFQKALKTVADR